MKVVQQDVSLQGHRLHDVLGGVLDGDAVNVAQTVQSKSISLSSPILGDDITLFITSGAITILSVVGVLIGASTPSVTYSIRHDTQRDAVGTLIVNASALTSTTTVVSATLADTTIPASSVVWLEVGAVSGTVTELHLTIFYRIDA